LLGKTEDHKKKIDDILLRLGDAETDIDLLKKLGAPKGDGAGAGLFDAINDLGFKLRSEFDAKLKDLLDRLMKLEDHTKAVDDDEQE